MHSSLHQFPAVVLIVFLGVLPALGQEKGDRQPVKTGKQIERLFEAILKGNVIDQGLSEHIPALIDIVEAGDAESCTLALCALARMKSAAAPAIGRICKKLSDPSHSIRSAAVDALVAIGDSAVPPVRKLLSFSSPTTRASAAKVLSRLEKLDLADLERLAQDPDPRVRFIAADGFSRADKPGVAALAKLLVDREVAVAVEAARGLQVNRNDPALSIPKLIEALPRAELGWAAARALAAYGVEARRAVPWIIKAYPLGALNRFDSAEVVLKHIGPPDAVDVPLMCEFLKHEDPEVRILAAESLALMGLQGRAAAQPLCDAAEASLQEYLALEQKSKTQSDDLPPNDGQILLAAELCTEAVWRVTQDSRRFVDAVEKFVLAAERPIELREPTPWQEFSVADCQLFDEMLRHANRNMRWTALVGVIDTEARSDPSRQMVFDIARGDDAELSRLAIRVLTASGESAAKAAAPILLSKLRDGTLSLEGFANAVDGMRIRLPEFQPVLEKGLQGKNFRTLSACARALRTTSADPRRATALIIDAARWRIQHRAAIGILKGFDSTSETVIPYLTEQLDNSDIWARRDAIDALGSFGKKAAASVDLLIGKLNDQSGEIRLTTAKAIFLITGDSQPLDKEMKAAFADEDGAKRFYPAMKVITQLGPAGAKFLPYVVRQLQISEPENADSLIEALAAIGTGEAVAALEATAGSTDWMLRSQSNAALRRIRNPAGKKGK